MGLPAKLSITNSNYFDYGKLNDVADGNIRRENLGLESIISGRVSVKTDILQGGALSIDAGVSANHSFGEKAEVSVSPFTELKYRQNIAKCGDFTFRGYGRQRITGEKIQERVSLGCGYKVNDELSVYADGHYTIKFDQNNFNQKAGGWVGINYRPKGVEGLNIWFEPVQINRDISPKGKWTVASNCGLSFNLSSLK